MSEIQIRDDGPLLVTGENLTLKDGAGNKYDLQDKETIALCRCGHSANKPFCDGHHRGKFESKCVAS
jgi:CDGSH-type Zn-finger protein